MDFWRQWYDAGTRMWSGMLGGGQGNSLDPYGLYRQWFENVENAWGQMTRAARSASTGSSPFAAMMGNPWTAAPFAALNPATAAQGDTVTQDKSGAPATAAVMGAAEAQNMWKQWFEATEDSWRQATELGRVAVDLTPRWLETLEQIRNNFLSAEGYPTDPLQLATRWYNATNGPLSEFVGDLIEREEFLEPSSQFLKSYASFYRVFRRNSEEYLKSLSIPVRSDIARVAELVVALEDKVDRIEEAFEDFEYGYAKPATAEGLQVVEERLERLEQTLGRVEDGAAGGGDTATSESVSAIGERLDDVEGKIDRLLAALENSSQNDGQVSAQETGSQEDEESGQQEADGDVQATAAARRKAEELGVDLAEVSGTGANGQITVDDVRRSNARGEEGEG